MKVAALRRNWARKGRGFSRLPVNFSGLGIFAWVVVFMLLCSWRARAKFISGASESCCRTLVKTEFRVLFSVWASFNSTCTWLKLLLTVLNCSSRFVIRKVWSSRRINESRVVTAARTWSMVRSGPWWFLRSLRAAIADPQSSAGIEIMQSCVLVVYGFHQTGAR